MWLLYILSLLTTLGLTHTQEAELKGNLIFQSHPTAILINPKLANFYRQVDLTYLRKSIYVLREFEKQYYAFCEKSIAKTTKEPKYFRHYQPTTFEAAQSECLRNGGQLPEVRTTLDADFLHENIKKQNLTHTYAGLVWDTVNHTLRYMSDFTPNTWPHFKPCENCTATSDVNELTKELDSLAYQTSTNIEFHYIYELGQLNIIPQTLQFGDKNKKSFKHRFICKVLEPDAKRILNTLAQHSCMRDRDNIRDTNDLITSEINQLYKPPTPVNDTALRKKRQYQEVATIVGGTETYATNSKRKSPPKLGRKIIRRINRHSHRRRRTYDKRRTDQPCQGTKRHITQSNGTNTQLWSSYRKDYSTRTIRQHERTRHSSSICRNG